MLHGAPLAGRTPSSEFSEPEFLAQGERVGDRFEIEGVAAIGGMSVVYRARDLETQALVAIKVLRGTDASTEQRFAAEAEILATISHPCIVRYVAHGKTPRGVPFIAMQWLAGEDLGTRLARAGLRASECLALVRQVCSGLTAAHERGVLHRDIKPSNVFLVGGSIESVKLLDFGVAWLGGTAAGVTQAGSFVGTVGYMSPEQTRGEHGLDVRTDVFSVGALLFECLTGQAAFPGPHTLAVLSRVLHEEPLAVCSLRPDLGSSFDALFARLLAKDRNQRPPSAQAALDAIEGAYAQQAVDDTVSAPSSSASQRLLERRILSVIAIGLRSTSDAAWLEDLAHDFEAELVRLSSQTWLMIPGTGVDSTATDQAVQAARCALRLAGQARVSLALALATGPVHTASHVPLGATVDRVVRTVESDFEGIQLDELTARLLGPRFRVRKAERGLVLDSEVEESESAAVLMGRSTPFVGRTTELAILGAGLRGCLADAVARAVLVKGAPGAGKSRLAREFLEQVKVDKAVRVLSARSDPMEAFSPLGLVQRLIRRAAGLRLADPIDTQRATLQTYLAAVLGCEAEPPLLGFLAEIVGVAAPQPEHALHRAARGDPEVMREQKRRAFERWVSVLVEQGPLLLFVEDLHWADLPSIAYLRDVVRSLPSKPLFVLATARPETDAQLSQLRDREVFEEIQLRGLSRKAAERLVRAMLPGDTRAAVIERIVSLAGGNAFYLEELVRRVAEDGSTELPETVVAMAQSRIERLPHHARRMLCTASVFGETLWAGGIEPDNAAPVDTAATLEWLVDQEILKPSAEARFPGEREFSFRHALLREAAYGMLSEAERRREHLRVAQCLERWGERDARVLADHFERGGAIERAVPWIAEAAMTALNSGDFENAMQLSQRGTSLGAEREQRGQLLLVRASASTWRGEPGLPDEALALLPPASAPWWLALSLGVYDSTVLGQPERAQAYLQLALTTSPDAEPTASYGHALQVLAAGAALVGRAQVGWTLVRRFERRLVEEHLQCEPAFLAWFNLSKCILASNSLVDGEWQLGHALECGRESIDAMRVLGSASGEAAALFHLGNAYWLVGNFERSLALLWDALKLGKETGNRVVEEHAELLLAVAAMREGSRSEAHSALERLATSLNLQVAHAAAAILADSTCRAGHFELAIARASDTAHGGAVMYRRMARATLARAYLGLGQFEQALAATEQAFLEGGRSAFPHLTVDLFGSRARALLGLGHERAAELTIREAYEFRDAAARHIRDEEDRTVFCSRGRANRTLDELAQRMRSDSRHS